MKIFKCRRVLLALWLVVFAWTLDTISHSFVEGKQKIPEKYKGLEREGTVKTIVDPEDDVVIDCVDFTKQPAFDNPLIKSLQVNPSYFPGETKLTNEYLKKAGLYQNWRKYGECPTGTIPIRRVLNPNSHWKKRLVSNEIFQYRHEYAVVTQPRGIYYGGRADFNVWAPKTEPEEVSIAQIWLNAGKPKTSEFNTVEAGWMVNLKRSADPRPVTFVYWTADDYQKTGCYDHDCPGFIQTRAEYALGVPQVASVYNNTYAMYDMNVELYLDQNGPYANWIYNLNGQQVGYFPSHLFNALTKGAESIEWGGEVVHLKEDGPHTSTQMGSGHIPEEGYTRASYVKNLAMMNFEKIWVDATRNEIELAATKPACYGIDVPAPTTDLGTHIFYGGPGYSEICR